MIKDMIMGAKNIKNMMDADSNKNEKFLDTEKNPDKYLTGLKEIYEYFDNKQKTVSPDHKELPQYAGMAVMSGFCYAKSLSYAKKDKALVSELCNSILETNLPVAPKEDEMYYIGDKLKTLGQVKNKMKM